MRAFHYAFKVKDIQSTRKFYIEMLGCKATSVFNSEILNRVIIRMDPKVN